MKLLLVGVVPSFTLAQQCTLPANMDTSNLGCQCGGSGCTLAELMASADGPGGCLSCDLGFEPQGRVPLTAAKAQCPGAGLVFSGIGSCQAQTAARCLLPEGTLSKEDACNFGIAPIGNKCTVDFLCSGDCAVNNNLVCARGYCAPGGPPDFKHSECLADGGTFTGATYCAPCCTLPQGTVSPGVPACNAGAAGCSLDELLAQPLEYTPGWGVSFPATAPIPTGAKCTGAGQPFSNVATGMCKEVCTLPANMDTSNLDCQSGGSGCTLAELM
eukprot:gene7216-6812_t